MRVARTNHFLRSYQKAPAHIRRTFDKQLVLLVDNLNHPSLHAKKYDEARGVWQARVNYTWRFYFKIEGNVYLLEEIKHHPK
jgi:hypothetical protein